jgi:hypothetical protein
MAGSNEDAVGAVSRTRGDPVAKKKKETLWEAKSSGRKKKWG